MCRTLPLRRTNPSPTTTLKALTRTLTAAQMPILYLLLPQRCRTHSTPLCSPVTTKHQTLTLTLAVSSWSISYNSLTLTLARAGTLTLTLTLTLARSGTLTLTLTLAL